MHIIHRIAAFFVFYFVLFGLTFGNDCGCDQQITVLLPDFHLQISRPACAINCLVYLTSCMLLNSSNVEISIAFCSNLSSPNYAEIWIDGLDVRQIYNCDSYPVIERINPKLIQVKFWTYSHPYNLSIEINGTSNYTQTSLFQTNPTTTIRTKASSMISSTSISITSPTVSTTSYIPNTPPTIRTTTTVQTLGTSMISSTDTLTNLPTDSSTSFDTSTSKFTTMFSTVLPITSTSSTTTTSFLTTTSSTVSTTSPTYSQDLSLAVVDLVIGISVTLSDGDGFNDSRELIKQLTKPFNYVSNNTHGARLSLFIADPTGQGYSEFNLWNLNSESISSLLDQIQPTSTGNSLIFQQFLNFTFFFNSNPFRNNVQRLFLVFTANDAVEQTNYIQKVKDVIDEYDIKMIFINTNSNILASNLTFPQLWKMTGTGSNRQNWYNFIPGSDNTKNILENFYFNGGNVCSIKNQNFSVFDMQNVINNAVPLLPTQNYCSYMNITQYYLVTKPGNFFQVYFPYFFVNEGKALIEFFVDDSKADELSKNGNYLYFCFQVQYALKLKFTSQEGPVYPGFTVQITEFESLQKCQS